MKKLFFLILMSTLISANVMADDKTWTGAVSNDWNNPANWQGNSIPGSNDNINIPSGTPNCELPSESVVCESITNNGTLVGNNSTIQTSSFTNNAYVNFESSLSITDKGSELNFENNANITGSNDSQFGIFITDNNEIGPTLNNNGTIESKEVYINAHTINNSSNGSVEGNVSIHCSGTFQNDGNIQGSTGVFGGDILIDTSKLKNNGTIKGGNATSDGEGDGGSVTIACTNHEGDGNIIGGDGSDNGGLGGNVMIGASGEFLIWGMLSGGYSFGGWGKDDPVAADMFLTADTIIIAPNDHFISGGNIHITGKVIRIADIDNFAGLIGELGIEINTTAEGYLDLSELHTESAVFAASGNISIYSDNIIEPSEGINFVMDPDPQVNGANTNIIGASVSSGMHAYSAPAENGIIEVRIQNQSTTAQTLHYTFSSNLDWVSTTNGSSDLLEPFEMAILEIPFTIPGNIEERTSDLVDISISIGGEELATGTAEITAIPDLIIGINNKPSQNQQLSLQLYPNPVTGDFVHFELSEAQAGEYFIFNTKGQEIQTGILAKSKKQNINIEQLQSGWYILEVKTDGQVMKAKLIL